MNIFKALFTIIIVLAVAGALLLGYLGFVPGLAKIFGSDKPRDLGIKYVQADYESAGLKNKIQIEVLDKAPDAKSSLKMEGKNPVEASFTSEEVTSRINVNQPNWKYFPVKDVQIKFNRDGYAEASGILLVDRLKNYARATGVQADAVMKIEAIFDKYHIPKNSFPVYMMGKAVILENKVFIDVSVLQIGKFTVPHDIYKEAKPVVDDFLSQQLSSGYPGLYIKSLNFDNGKLNFNGTLPAKITTAREVLQ